jgi:hypothetical protein
VKRVVALLHGSPLQFHPSGLLRLPTRNIARYNPALPEAKVPLIAHSFQSHSEMTAFSPGCQVASPAHSRTLAIVIAITIAQGAVAKNAKLNDPDVLRACSNHNLTVRKCVWLRKAMQSVAELFTHSENYDNELQLYNNAGKYLDQYGKLESTASWSSVGDKHTFEGFYLGHDDKIAVLRSDDNRVVAVPINLLSDLSLKKLLAISKLQCKIHLAMAVVDSVTSDSECMKNEVDPNLWTDSGVQ